ncbi:MAG: cobalamin biosynthesis protein CobD [Candidatus Omnitrophica bacterium]|nr:cobalamin biosynthesis protein CobD [Candidatus Omnitrophota bacterium]
MHLILLCYFLDLILGDPEWMPHPVRLIGGLINFLEKKLPRSISAQLERIMGIVTVLIIVGVTVYISYLFLYFSAKINPVFGMIAYTYLGYTTISVKDLWVKANAVTIELENDCISAAREKLSKIVGRDTHALEKDEIALATVESIAESTNDGIVAPIFYLLLGGPVLAIAYKSINTLDSMLGYKDAKYLNFGWFSAKLDDMANFVPARITGLLIAIASFLCGKNFIKSFMTMVVDGRKHPSPNSGISEAAMAGALGVRLGGLSYYGGQPATKPYIGNKERAINFLLIGDALKVSLISSALIIVFGGVLRWII